jgi:hypothetical protein
VIYYLKCMFVKAFKNAPAFALYRIVLMMYGVRRLLRFLRAIARIFLPFFIVGVALGRCHLFLYKFFVTERLIRLIDDLPYICHMGL